MPPDKVDKFKSRNERKNGKDEVKGICVIDKRNELEEDKQIESERISASTIETDKVDKLQVKMKEKKMEKTK
jgi:hypothetical protein